MDELDDSRRLTRARMVLERLGLPMAGTVVTAFAVRLLDGLDQDLDDDANVTAVLDHAPEGHYGLLADEPILGAELLDEPADSAAIAVEATVRRLAHRILSEQRRAPATPPAHPTPADVAARRTAYEADRPQRIERALEDLHSEDWTIRANATTRLAHAHATDAADAIRNLLNDPQPEVGSAARAALEHLAAGPQPE